MKIAIPNLLNPHRPSHEWALKLRFGLATSRAKWPSDGIQNPDDSTKTIYAKGDWGWVELWVDPIIPNVKRHRAMARCPVCGAVMSAGRLQQHCSLVHKDV